MLQNTYSKSHVTKLCLYTTPMIIDNTNKPVQTALKYNCFNTQITQGFYLNGGHSLAFGTIWLLNLKSIENTTIQQNICLILSPNTEKLNIQFIIYNLKTYIVLFT